MKKRILPLLLSLALAVGMVIPAAAYTNQQMYTAQAMNSLGLFAGTGTSYELDKVPTREEGMVLLVAMLGCQNEALEGNYDDMPFTDVSGWAKPYVGYAWKNGLTAGVSKTEFGSKSTMTDAMYLTMTLQALGFKAGAGNDFLWNKPYGLAKQVGLISYETADAGFDRGSTVEMFWNALDACYKGKTEALGDHLLQQGVFTKAQLTQAEEIQKNGVLHSKPYPSGYTWEEYQALSSAEKNDFITCIGGAQRFSQWYEAAKAVYDKQHPVIDLDNGGVLDFSKLP